MLESTTQHPVSDSILRVEQVSMTLGGRRVLHEISLEFYAGQVLAILGPTAAGKTTLLRTLAGVILPDEGRIGFNSALDLPGSVGWVGHQSFLYDELTVAENLRFRADLIQVKNPARRVEEVIDQLGLTLVADERIDILSFGTVRRVSIGRAILADPKLLLLDEAFTGLDQAGVDWLLGLINEYKRKGSGVILTSHQISLGLEVATNLMVLCDGRSMLSGPLDRFDRSALKNDYLAYAKSCSAPSQAGGAT